jgi:hypothetical protein
LLLSVSYEDETGRLTERERERERKREREREVRLRETFAKAKK